MTNRRNWIVNLHNPEAEAETDTFGPYTEAAATAVVSRLESLIARYGIDFFATAHPIQKWQGKAREQTVAMFKRSAEDDREDED